MKNCTPIFWADHQPDDEAVVIRNDQNGCNRFSKTFLPFILLLFFFVPTSAIMAQLGVYNFTGTGACPNQNPSITSQPSNGVFSNYSGTSVTCVSATNVWRSRSWNTSGTINTSEYLEFTLTPNANYALTLTSISFSQYVNEVPGGGTTWILRSSIDNYAANITTGSATTTLQTPSITLPAANFTHIGAVTFRFYIINARTNNTQWTNDAVTINGTIDLWPPDPPNPTSNSPQCTSPGVTLARSGSPASDVTWYWQTSAGGTSTANSGSTYVVTSSGTYYIRAQNNNTLTWSVGAGSLAVIITPNVGTPAFIVGATSTRCQGSGTVTYTATATNTTGITYSLDATSLAGGNTINGATGAVSYAAGWSGTSIITASAAGCGGPSTATHTVTVTPTVGTPTFTLGATSTRCQGAGSVTYTATATNNTGITYTLDATSLAGSNTINAATGAVTYVAGWSGTSVITATATGCNGPSVATHTVTINQTVTSPVFTPGATSTRCQGAGTVTYTATATNTTGITYTLDATSLAGSNTINATTGAVTYVAGWSGTSVITASAAGCGGPLTVTHTVTITPSVGTPVFTLGASSSRCEGAGSVTYTATATNTTGITYTLDGASITGGNTINSSTGAVTYVAGWSGTSVITASATGCNGPSTATHTVTINPAVGTPVFTLGATSTRCQGAGTVTYTATATNSTGITYSLNAPSLAAGNTINAATGAVTYIAGWSGTTIITAGAAGCYGPTSATHTVTITPTVGTPVFTLGATSTRCQGAATVLYTATATNNTGISYSLDATSLAGGNTINASTGDVTYVAGWSGTSIITASAAGCGGPSTATHTVTVTPTVGTPTFTLGATSTRCQGAGSVTYTATATNNTGITYTLDATSLAGSNTINAATGAVTYVAGWSGTSVITATATGCNGPSVATHTVTINQTVTSPVFTPGATSTRCQGAGTVTYTATATNTTGITYTLDATSLAGSNTINATTGAVTYVAGWSGTSVITASAAGCGGPLTVTHTVTITPSVGTPVFTLGASSSRCEGAGSVTYTATATNTTGITYTLDGASITGGNTINSSTGAVTYVAGWSGTSVITASATGCNGPSTATHTVTINPAVGTPVFTLGATSTRCQGAGTVTYTATATNSTGITYSLNAPSLAAGNTINAATGAVTYIAGWSGTTIITAGAAGCYGPTSATHTVTITPTVGTPVFTLGATSTRCQGAATVSYTATATNTTGITYSLDATSILAGNTINSSTGDVTFLTGWTGTTVITASAAGCGGPKTANHTVTVTSTVGTPVFTLGATSTRCQGAGSVTYTATATNNTGITYTLDATSLAGSNTINAATGAVTYVAGWSGTSVITATATGCNGPSTATHTVTITPTVGTPVFTLGASSTRCQGAGSTTYTATATNTTVITYSLDAPSISAGNSINSSTGAVTFVAGWTGVSTITASAAGCNGPKTATHTVTTAGLLANPTFALGSTSVRSQGAGTVTYTASATNNTGITYTLDATSLAGGNTINASTGAVTYVAGWSGASLITVTATGCGGPKTALHSVTTNSISVFKQLYLSDPAQSLDRVDPVNTADNSTATTAILSSGGTTNTTFTMGTALCSGLTIKAGTITVRTYVTITSGSMPANPTITALLKYGATTIITLTNPTYTGGTNLVTWTAVLGADVNVPTGQAIALQITTAQAGVNFRIDYDSQTKPSRIDLPVSTFINMTSMNVYSAAYPGGSIVASGVGGTTKYIRATVSDPFGFSDITAMNITITPPGNTVAATSVATSGCTRTYEYVWTTPVTGGSYLLTGVTKEGYENTVTFTRNIYYDVCTTCPPVANTDSVSGAGGSPIVVDVLANDTDPNSNMNNSSITVTAQPRNGSAFVSNNTILYLPNGTFSGNDTLTYQVCDFTSPTPLCATAQVYFRIDPTIVDICGDAVKTHTYYIPYPEAQAYTALAASGSIGIPSSNIRTVISIKVPYPGMTIVWDEWEDGYESNALNPAQSTTKVWGDGDPYNGIAPGFPNDLIPAGGSIVLDNTMAANPRNPASFYYDGKDKVVSSGQIAMTQVSGEPSIMAVQAIKTNITSTFNFGQSFTIPLGQDFNSQDFNYTALFVRASQNNTVVNIDKDNNGTFETTTTLNEGESYLLNGGVLTGATVTSDKPVGVELNAGGIDNYSIRNAPIFPATWYGSTYYTPVPTSDVAGDNPKDTSIVMLYNSLNREINIDWSSGAPANGTINIPAKSAVRFPLAYSASATYKFVNPTGESFTAIEIVDSYTPGGGGNGGTTYDWAFNLISEARLSDYATIAWAPGSLDGSRNDNPIWVTPTVNTTLYVKYDGDIANGPSTSPCGFKYDVAINVNALNYAKIKDPNDNDQGGMAVYTCNGAKISAVYGEDPATAVAASPSWDVGSTIQPFCKQKLVIAEDDFSTTLVNQPVTISVLNNDVGFLATIDPASVTTLGLLQAAHGTVTINANGTVLYRPNTGFVGLDTFEYRVCSTPSPIVCDVALVIISINVCPSNNNQNTITGQVFVDINKDGLNNDGGSGYAGAKVYLYTDGNCNGTINPNELIDSLTVDNSGYYQFVKYPEKTIEDDFDGTGGTRTCANGTDGNTAWAADWVDAGDPSTGYCNTSQTTANTDAEIVMDGAFSYGLRLKDNNVSSTRSLNLSGASKAYLTFDYRRKSALASGEDVLVQASSNGSTFTTIYTISGDGTTDANYVTVYNQDITSYASATSAIRFLTNNSVDDADTVYIDNISIRYLKYSQCYITQLASSSLPADYYTTTSTEKAKTFASGGSCASQFDFGMAKLSISISGNLYNDKNGLVNSLVDGPAIGTPGGVPIYAYLADSTGKVAFKTLVNSVTGAYSFPLANVNTTYQVRLSSSDVSFQDNLPGSLGLPAGWVTVGDSYGTNNGSGSGIETGSPDCYISARTGVTNITNVNFGIERLPDSYDYTTSITHPMLNQFITLNGGINPPVLGGSDPEDYSAGGVLSNRPVMIDTIPSNAELYYNNVLVTDGQFITNFNASLLQVKITTATLGDSIINFRYSYVDSAGKKDPSPALYSLTWNIPLPATGLIAQASLYGDIATIKWSTLSEQNTDHFELERSLDHINFSKIGQPVMAAGNTDTKREYQQPDNISGLYQQPVIYYRVKLIDFDGLFKYSNVVAVRLNRLADISGWPNPFSTAITLNIPATQSTELLIRLTDIAGREMMAKKVRSARGSSQVILNGLDKLSKGVYLVDVFDILSGNKSTLKFIKNE